MDKLLNSKEGIPGNDPGRGGGAASALKMGIAGALAAVICCVGPLVPILLGVGAGAALFGLDRYKPLFIALGLAILALASWVAVRSQNRCCTVRSTARNVRTVAMIFGTGIAAYLLLQFAVVPMLASLASSRVAAASHASGEEAAPSTLRLQVEGMTCAGCAVGVEHALLDVLGVRSAKVDWQAGTAVVQYDEGRVSAEEILKAKVPSHYTLRRMADPDGLNEEQAR
jgi:copper chaperone CopZ